MKTKSDEATTMTSDTIPVENENKFDPLKDLFVAQSAKPSQLLEINLRALTPFQRALLTIDGTVTKFIEAYTMEPVGIIILAQEKKQLPADHVWLDAQKGTEVISRQVLLRGMYSNRVYAYALSLVVPYRIIDITKKELELDAEGLGRFLLSSRIETYREILWYGKESSFQLPDAIDHLAQVEFISRTYRIIAGGEPIMLISEKFPSDKDRLPSHH